MSTTEEPNIEFEGKTYRVYVRAYCSSREQAEVLLSDLEEAVGKNNADLDESDIDEEEV
jgi:hypothetical protein